jgi:hypothetical protein
MEFLHPEMSKTDYRMASIACLDFILLRLIDLGYSPPPNQNELDIEEGSEAELCLRHNVTGASG